MKQAVAVISCLLLVAVSGCGGSPDSLIQEQIQAMNDTAAAIEGDQPESKIKAGLERIKAINEKLKALNLSDAQKKAIREKHGDALSSATFRLQKAMMSKAMKNLGEGFPGFPKLGK